MNIFGFINSKDLKEYFLSINYEFSLIDKAFEYYLKKYQLIGEISD